MEKKKSAFSPRDMAICGLFVALIAAGAKLRIVIPVTPYPMNFTMQWFFVLLSALMLGRKRAGASMLVYLILGVIGLPIFARGGGPAYLMKPTFGYLVGFLVAAYGMAWMVEKDKKQSFLSLTVITVVGLFTYYGFGMVYFYFMGNLVLGAPVTWWMVVIDGFGITVFADFALCILAVIVSQRLLPAVRQYL